MEQDPEPTPVPAPRAASPSRAGFVVSPATLVLLVAAGFATFAAQLAVGWWVDASATPSVPRDIGKALFAVPIVAIYATGVWLGIRTRRGALDAKKAVPLCAGTFAAAISIPLTIEVALTSQPLDPVKLLLMPVAICAGAFFFCVIGWRQGRSPRSAKKPFGL